MVTLRSDFECGNGKNVSRLGPDRLSLEVDGDLRDGYASYFCFDLANDGDACDVVVEIHPDSALANPAAFISCFPSTVWVRGNPAFGFRALEAERVRVVGTHLEALIPLPARAAVRVAMTYVAPYSAVSTELRALAASRPDRASVFSIGASVEGRDLLGLRVGVPGMPRVYVVAGQHPHEHSGVWAALGVADWVSSLLGEADELRRALEVWVLPIVNPDGNVRGRNALNAEGVDMYRAFASAPDSPEPEGKESRLLWSWVREAPPALWMNFHSYTGWRQNSEPPYDGWYEVPDETFADPSRLRMYRSLCDAVRLLTDARSTSRDPARHAPGTFCYQMAKRFGIPHVFYEVNNGTAGAHRGAERGIRVFRAAAAALVAAQGSGGRA